MRKSQEKDATSVLLNSPQDMYVCMNK